MEPILDWWKRFDVETWSIVVPHSLGVKNVCLVDRDPMTNWDYLERQLLTLKWCVVAIGDCQGRFPESGRQPFKPCLSSRVRVADSGK